MVQYLHFRILKLPLKKLVKGTFMLGICSAPTHSSDHCWQALTILINYDSIPSMVSNHNTLKGLQVEHGFYIAFLKEQRDFLTFIGPSHCFTFSKIRWILKETLIYIYIHICAYIVCLSMPPPKLAKHIISKHFQSILILINISLPRPRRNSPFRVSAGSASKPQ